MHPRAILQWSPWFLCCQPAAYKYAARWPACDSANPRVSTANPKPHLREVQDLPRELTLSEEVLSNDREFSGTLPPSGCEVCVAAWRARFLPAKSDYVR